MGREISEKYPRRGAAFDEADAALDFPISRLCFEGPEEDLKLTENTQPAILTTSIALFRVLEEKGIRPDFVAGHSLGEYSALVAAGALQLSRCGRAGAAPRAATCRKRCLSAWARWRRLLGLDLPAVQSVCETAAEGQVVSPANLNSPGQIVIAGNREAVERAVDHRERGRREARDSSAGERAVSLRIDDAGRRTAGRGSGRVRVCRFAVSAGDECRCSADHEQALTRAAA